MELARVAKERIAAAAEVARACQVSWQVEGSEGEVRILAVYGGRKYVVADGLTVANVEATLRAAQELYQRLLAGGGLDD